MLGEWNLRGLVLNVKRLHRVRMSSYQSPAFYSRCSADSLSLRLEMKVIGLKLLTPDGSFRSFLPGAEWFEMVSLGLTVLCSGNCYNRIPLKVDICQI